MLNTFLPRKGSQWARAEGIKFVMAERVSPNILVLAGAPSSGKTHLLHALASHAKRNFYIQTVACLSAFQFANEVHKGLVFDDLPIVLQRFTEDCLLAIDDVDRLFSSAKLTDSLLNVLQTRQMKNRRTLLSITLSHANLESHPMCEFLLQLPAVTLV